MFIKKIGGYIRLLWALNITKTLYFNFKVFPFGIGAKLPIYFFGPVRFAKLNGKITLDTAHIKRGMVQFGNKEENIIATKEPTRISVEGELIFKGENIFAHAIQLLVWTGGRLTIGSNSSIGSFSKLIAFRSITIGNNLLASWECQLFDTDFHFIENTATGIVTDTNGQVIIGENVWLGSRITILKNTIIPDDSIIATGSVCNKDYTVSCPKGSLIGGIPAKLLKQGIRYVNDKKMEKKLFAHFQQPQNFGGNVNKKNFEIK